MTNQQQGKRRQKPCQDSETRLETEPSLVPSSLAAPFANRGINPRPQSVHLLEPAFPNKLLSEAFQGRTANCPTRSAWSPVIRTRITGVAFLAELEWLDWLYWPR